MLQRARLGVTVVLAVTLTCTPYSIPVNCMEFPLDKQAGIQIKTVEQLLQEDIDKLPKPVAPVIPVIKAEPIKELPTVQQKVVDLTAEEYDLLVHLVNAEAGEDGIESKIGVVNVVFNRMKDKQFPNSLTEVIYQRHQFEVVSNGTIDKEPSKESYEAVDRALQGENPVGNCLYFWAGYLDDSNSIWQQDVYMQIDSTVFGR